MATPSLSWLDDFFGPAIVRFLTTFYPKRPVLHFLAGVGATLNVEDDPTGKATKVTVGGGYVGTKGRYVPVYGEVTTSSTSQTTLASFAMSDESACLFEAWVWHSRGTNTTKAGGWKRLAVYRRTGGGSPTIVGSVQTPVDLETTAGDDVTIDFSGNAVRVRVTAADSDPRNWSCVLHAYESRAV